MKTFFGIIISLAVIAFLVILFGAYIGQVYYHHKYGGLSVIERIENLHECKYLMETNDNPYIEYVWDYKTGTYMKVDSSWEKLYDYLDK